MHHFTRLLLLTALLASAGTCNCEEPLPPLDLSEVLEAGEVRGGRCDKAEDLIGGPWADSRVGDYKLYNSKVRFIVQDLDPVRSAVGFYGGNLIDADVVRRDGSPDHDTMALQNELVGLLGLEPEKIEVVNDGRDGQAAVLQVEGHAMPIGMLPEGALGLGLIADDVEIFTRRRYILEPDAELLRIETEVFNRGEQPLDGVMLGDVFYFSGYGQVFTEAAGFDLLLGADPYLVSEAEDVAYAVSTGGGNFELMFGLHTIVITMARSTDIAPGRSAIFDRFFSVGRGGISAAAAPVFAMLDLPHAIVHGQLRDAADQSALTGVRVQVFEEESDGSRGKILTTARSDAEGHYRAAVPLARNSSARGVQLEARAEGRAPSPVVSIEVQQDAEREADLSLPPGGQLRLTVLDADSGQPIPARVDLHGDDGRQRLITGVVEALFDVVPGTYRLVASRGIEYSFHEIPALQIGAGEEVSQQITLQRVVDTTGYVAADLHLHSVRSTDSTVRLPDRVAAVAAEGVEFAAATDHDHVTDYTPHVHSRALEPWLETVRGSEVSTFTLGHFNGYPLAEHPDLPANGAIAWYGLSPADIFAVIRERGEPSVVVQVNHPRYEGAGFFDQIGLDQSTGIATVDPLDLGLPGDTDLNDLPFDVLEVYNGKRLQGVFGDDGRPGGIYDFYALLNSGRRYTMTGNSDSHSLGAEPGLPRNFIASASDQPGELDVDSMMAALRGGNNLVTAGPFVRFAAQAGGQRHEMGALVPAAGGADLLVEVEAATWVDVSSVELVENGEVIASWTAAAGEISGSDQVLRFDQSIPVTPTSDSWYLVIVRGDLPMNPVYGERPLALANPIYLDVDADGRFQGPWQ